MLKPPMPYPGGKGRTDFLFTVTTTVGYEWQDVEERSPNGLREYREPFLGGGGALVWNVAYLRNVLKVSPTRVWLNDADPAVAAVWTALIRHPDDLIRAFWPPLDPKRQLYDAVKVCCETLKRVPSRPAELIDAAVNRLYLAHWSRSANVKSSFSDPTTQAGRRIPYPRRDTLRAVAEFLSALDIRGGECTCLDFSEVIGTPGPALTYADPPYVGAGRQLYPRYFTEVEHRRLAGCLRATPNPWVLSYDDAPLVAELYPASGNVVSASEVRSHLAARLGGKSVSRRELVITPDPPQRISSW